MADVWNPMDPNNPIYAELARQSGAKKASIRNVALVVGTLLISGYLSNRQ